MGFKNFGRIQTMIACSAAVLLLFWPLDSMGAETPTMEGQKQNKVQTDEILLPDRDEDESSGFTFLDEKVTLSLLAEFIISYMDIEDESDRNSGALWDGYLGSAELGLNISFNEWLKADLLVEIQDVGKKGDQETLSLGEVFVTLKQPGMPLYLVGGKMTLPFGVFEDHMISGTITEDLYEIDDTGFTLGAASDDFRLDLSFTAYEGQDVIENLQDMGTHEFNPDRQKTNSIESYILKLSMEPCVEAVQWYLYYNSEPGDGRRNQSIGSALSVHISDFTFDAEYVAAIAREDGEDDEENLESAWFLALACQPADALEIALRYERFHDDRRGDQDEMVLYRYLAGMNYEMTDYATWSMEYRYTRFEREAGSEAASDQNEITLQLSIGF